MCTSNLSARFPVLPNPGCRGDNGNTDELPKEWPGRAGGMRGTQPSTHLCSHPSLWLLGLCLCSLQIKVKELSAPELSCQAAHPDSKALIPGDHRMGQQPLPVTRERLWKRSWSCAVTQWVMLKARHCNTSSPLPWMFCSLLRVVGACPLCPLILCLARCW